MLLQFNCQIAGRHLHLNIGNRHLYLSILVMIYRIIDVP